MKVKKNLKNPSILLSTNWNLVHNWANFLIFKTLSKFGK
jgi:hypothetical protein